MTDTAFLQRLLNLPEHGEIQRFLRNVRRVRVKKGTVLVEPDRVQVQLAILVSGVFRGFLLDAEGRDVTDCFAFRAGEILMGCNDLTEPSHIYLEAVTNGEVLLLPMEDVLAALEEIPELMGIYNSFLRKALARHWEEKMLMHQCAAMERYQWFLREYSGLIDAVSNKHIASFLGMTPVTLSRLRRKLREEPAEEGG